MIRRTLTILVVVATLGACSNMNTLEQRALSGGAIGAAGGAAVGLLTGGSVLTGALIGAGGGAAVGALTSQHSKSSSK